MQSKLDSLEPNPSAAEDFSEYELMMLVNYVLSTPKLTPKEKEQILKQLFTGKPALLEKLLANHTAFKVLFKEKQAPEIPTPITTPMASLNPTVQIKSQLDWIKPLDNGQNNLAERLKLCLQHELKLNPTLFKNMIKLPIPTPPISSQAPIAPIPAKNPTAEAQKKENEDIFNALITELNRLKMTQDTLHAELSEASELHANLLSKEKEAASEMMRIVIDKIHDMINALHTSKTEPVPQGLELLKLLANDPDAAKVRFEELIQQHQNIFSEDERQLFAKEEVPLTVKIPLFNYVETADHHGIKATMRPNVARIISEIYCNINLNSDQQQHLALEHVLLAFVELNQLLMALESQLKGYNHGNHRS